MAWHKCGRRPVGRWSNSVKGQTAHITMHPIPTAAILDLVGDCWYRLTISEEWNDILGADVWYWSASPWSIEWDEVWRRQSMAEQVKEAFVSSLLTLESVTKRFRGASDMLLGYNKHQASSQSARFIITRLVPGQVECQNSAHTRAALG